MPRSTEKAKKPIDVDALIKGMKDNARVEALDAEARVSTKKKESPKKQDLPRAKGGQSKVGNSPKVTPKKSSY